MAKDKSIHQYECESCGATMAFDGECGNLKCAHCGTEKEVLRDRHVVERGFEEMIAHSKWSDSNVASYRCDNCGATTMLNASAIATSCPYCNSPVVLDSEGIESVRPDTTVPFNIGRNRAQQAMIAWRKKRFWAPKAFQNSKSVDDMHSTYAPMWTFDSDTTTRYKGRVGYRRTRTVTRNGKKVTETYIEWRSIAGVIDYTFDDIIVRGSDHVPEKYFGKLLPYPQSHYVGYDDDYLAGHIADNYTVPPQEAYDVAVSKMQSIIRQAIANRYHADVVGDINLNMTFNSRSFKYVMVPVYVATSTYQAKQYSTYVSGITIDDKIKISGATPVSAIKVLIAVLLAIVLIVGVVLLLDYVGSIDLGIFASVEGVAVQSINGCRASGELGSISSGVFS